MKKRNATLSALVVCLILVGASGHPMAEPSMILLFGIGLCRIAGELKRRMRRRPLAEPGPSAFRRPKAAPIGRQLLSESLPSPCRNHPAGLHTPDFPSASRLGAPQVTFRE